MRRSIVTAAFFVLVGGFATHGAADPIAINVLDTHYEIAVQTSVYLSDFPRTYRTTSQTTTSDDPVSDFLSDSRALTEELLTFAEAGATANLFETSVETRGHIFSGAAASALAELTFSPVSDASGSLSLDFAGWNEWYFSNGYISLLDLTLNQEVWNYGWVFPGRGDVPWIDHVQPDFELPRATAAVAVETELFASHAYLLTLWSQVGADSDSQRITMRVSGLTPVNVPEPAMLTLLTLCGMGLLGYASASRRLYLRVF